MAFQLESRFELARAPGLRVRARPGLAGAILDATAPARSGAAAERCACPASRNERGTVRFTEVAGERAAVRHYWRGGLIGRFVRDLFFDPRRPFRELDLYDEALAAHVPTLEPLGAVARRTGLFWRFDLVTRAVDGAADLGALFASGLAGAPPARRRAVLRAAAAAVRALHEAGIEHADLNLRNLLAVEPKEGGAPAVLVIDLDRARRRGAPLPERARLANLLRLYRSARKLSEKERWPLSRRDLLGFGRAYFERDRAALRRAAAAIARYEPWIAVRRLFWRPSGDVAR
jgi:3-deoxy-D-manno-octulosonic acid kinase